MKFEVTVGICARNGEKTIRATIESIEDQVFPKQAMEIIFVDDGSTDGTLNVIKDFCSKTEIRTKTFSQSWKGLGAIRNIVINNAEGRYVMWVDSDMRLEKEYVKKHVELMDQKPNVGVAKARYFLSQSSKYVSQLEASSRVGLLNDSQLLIGTGGSMFRVRAIKEAGGFDEHITGAGEDIEALARMFKNGWSFEFVDTTSYEYFKDNWKDLWRQYYWYGYGVHYVRHKHKNLLSLIVHLPPIAFASGIRHFLISFKLHKKTIDLLLPPYEVFRNCAWLFGFLASHHNRFGHRKR